MALIRKNSKSDATSVPKQKIIKVNPYENPENVMELMARICSAVPNADTDIYWNVIRDAYNKEIRGKSLCEYLEENRGNLLNVDFKHDLNELCRQLSWILSTRENTEHTQIVVAGGFSSGKSSFLNRLTNSTNLLPTGVEPVSVVKTYLYCSRNSKSISVKGVNQKNVLVDLNPGVLQAIQHAKKSNIFLASVLDKLFVEIPSQDLNGIVFIDTPGYNNSDKANRSNGKTDMETAIEALGEGNVLFWLVDCERGTTVSNDIEIIKQFIGKKVFIFNKADKKGAQECVKIVDEAANTLYREFHKKEIIDIIAYSTLDNTVYYSKNKMTLSAILSEAKKSGNGTSEANSLKKSISGLFDDEITASKNIIKKLEETYQEKLDKKNESQKNYNAAKDYQDNIMKKLRDGLIDSYNDVMAAADKITKANLNTLKRFSDFINAMYHWDNTDHKCWDNTLKPKIDSASRQYDLCYDKHYAALDYQYYDEDARMNLVDMFDKEESFVVEQFKDFYDEACQECENAIESRTSEQVMVKDMEEYRRVFLSALDLGIKQYQNQIKATSIHDEEYTVPNIFECIKKDDYKLFLHSFEEGVDLSVCNADGYNPLTLAVHVGNNMMVQFMLDHDADPSIKDKRGYNAFHTAVEEQYRDICKILLDTDPELIDSTTDSGESVDDLAKKQTFSKWIKQEIDNAI